MSTSSLPEPSQESAAQLDAVGAVNGDQNDELSMPSSQPVLLRAMRWGAVASVILMVVMGVIGWWVSGATGLVGGAMGAGFAWVFLAFTVGSIAFANRFIRSDKYVGIFFGVVLGGWLVKFVAFLVAVLLLRDQEWLNAQLLFFGVVAGVIVSLVIDVLVVTRSRLPILSSAR